MVTERLRGRGINNESDAMGEEKKRSEREMFSCKIVRKVAQHTL